MLNAVTIAAVAAACWAHPQGVSYLAKIDQINTYSIECGNPCCNGGGIGHARGGKKRYYVEGKDGKLHLFIGQTEREARERAKAFLLSIEQAEKPTSKTGKKPSKTRKQTEVTELAEATYDTGYMRQLANAYDEAKACEYAIERSLLESLVGQHLRLVEQYNRDITILLMAA